MLRYLACAGLLLVSTSVLAEEATSFCLSDLEVGQEFELQTEDLLYRGAVVNRTSGECRLRISTGEAWSPPRTVFLIGATQGKQDGLSLIRMGEVVVGRKLELGLDDLADKNRALTTKVKSVRVDEKPLR